MSPVVHGVEDGEEVIRNDVSREFPYSSTSFAPLALCRSRYLRAVTVIQFFTGEARPRTSPIYRERYPRETTNDATIGDAGQDPAASNLNISY